MTNSRKLIIEVVADASSVDRGLKKAERSASGFSRRIQSRTGPGGLLGDAFGGVGKAGPIGAGIAAGAAVATVALKKFTAAGSDLNEQITKSEQVFGASSKSIDAWSKTTAKSAGISRTQALEAAGTFGNLFSSMKIGEKPAAQMSKRLVGLASDLASFNNANPEDVLLALRSGLIGEAEPLRKFGVLLSETRVQQQAMADTGKLNAKQLTDQEKAAARFELILRDTTKAQGDFSRTSGGLANQQRILKARFADVQAEIGVKLLPIITKLAAKAIEFLDWSEKNWPRFAKAIGDTYRSAKPVIDNIVASVKAVGDVVLGVVKIIQGIRDGEWSKVWGGMKQVVVNQVEFMYRAFAALPVKIAKAIGKAAFGQVERLFTAALNRIIGLINKAIGAYNRIPFVPNIPKIGNIGAAAAPSPPSRSVRSRPDEGTRGPASAAPVVNVYMDSKKVGSSVRRTNTVHARANPTQRRGRRR